MTTRLLKDWINEYERYSSISESPASYHRWAAVSCIAGALQRRVFMKWGYSFIYPNNYIVLVGPSGQARKGDPIKICKGFLEDMNIVLISEDNSEEAVIQDIKGSITSIIDPVNPGTKFQCAVSCCVEELAVFTGYQNSRFLAYLTNWYDSGDKWTRRTKHQGTDEVVGLCFNLLAATAPDWIPHIMTAEAIGGGFTSRVIFVVEERKEKIVSNPNLIPPDNELRRRLLHDLEAISAIVGEYKFDKEALAFYETWYTGEEEKIQKGTHPMMTPVFSGYVSRRATHIKKVAMAIAAGQSGHLVVTLADIQRAIRLLEAAEKNMPKAFAGVGRSKLAVDIDAIAGYIEQKGSVKKSELLATFYHDIDDMQLESIINILYGMHMIDVIRQPEQNDTVYKRAQKRTTP